MLLTMDLDAVVKFGPAAGPEKDQRIHMEVRQKQTFQLTVRQVRTSDSGPYRCEVDEWLQDPLGDWYSLKKLSDTTELVVREKGNKTHIYFIAMAFSLNLHGTISGTCINEIIQIHMIHQIHQNKIVRNCHESELDSGQLLQRRHF